MQLARRDWILLAVSVALAAVVPAFTFFFVPMWRGLYAAFPEKWPESTRLLFNYYWLTVLFPICVLAVWARTSPSKRALASVGLAVLGGGALLVLIWHTATPTELTLEAIRRTYQ